MRVLSALLLQHGVYSLEKQDLLQEYLGEHRWDLDLQQHTLDFGGDRVFRPQVLGTTSESAGTWLWAWENSSVPTPMAAASRSLHRLLTEAGVQHFAEAEAPLGDLDSHVLGMVASGLLEADAYYLAHHPGGAVLLLLTDRKLAALRTSTLTHVSSYFTTFISSWDVHDHHAAFAAYLRAKGLVAHEKGAIVWARHPDGTEVRGIFDEQRLLVKLEIKLGAGGAQGRRDA